jgi:3-hydroxybutyryl-CoA dehydratase
MEKLLSNINLFEATNKVIGYTISDSRIVYEKDVINFAQLSGDNNPIHLDDTFASKSIFKNKVAHGMYIASFFSKLLGDKKYGFSGVYLSQNLKFLNPVYINEKVDITIELIEINKIKSTGIFKTVCKVNDKEVIDGIATILFLNK